MQLLQVQTHESDACLSVSVGHYVSVDLITREENTVSSLNIQCLLKTGDCDGRSLANAQASRHGKFYLVVYICSLHIHTYLMYSLTVQGNVSM
jgi:hypothetical protein